VIATIITTTPLVTHPVDGRGAGAAERSERANVRALVSIIEAALPATEVKLTTL